VIFREISLSQLSSERPRELFPSSFRTLILDVDALQAALREVPSERDFMAGEVLPPSIALLNPEGTLSEYSVVETPTMDEALAQQYPEIRTFRGQGITDPAEILVMDVTPRGLHAMILSPRGMILIDPLTAADNLHYLIYFKQDAPRVGKPFLCRERESLNSRNFDTPAPTFQATPALTVGESLKTYRTAIGATGEFTSKVCAPSAAAVPCGLAAVVTIMNRVNGLFERDASVRMVLVANESLLIYTNAATDPYTNDNLGTMLAQNQSALDAVIGNANYDVGHAFGTTGGGLAGGRACDPNFKGTNATGLDDPLADFIMVDYVSHEMGHQLGASHTFNGTSDGCGGSRNADTAYEPGSGSTLLSYAGLCGTEMLQSRSDSYYHTGSIGEMLAFLAAAGASCGTSTATGNVPPAVTTTPSFTIPARTPFLLSGSATDANGDGLTYSWEELDLGAAAPPNDDVAAERPIFRSFPPVLVPYRTFPKLSDLLGNTSTLGESLPTRTRNMNFRFTVRDNRAGGGGVGFGSTMVSVAAGAGPFAVTSPNTAVTWPALSSQTVAWNVANTNAAPVSCGTVSITLSTNGGNTFPLILKASTPNDGSEAVLVPNLQTTKARIRVACVGNIFFDLSNANFSITGGPPAGSFLYTLSPCRVLDTRDPFGVTGGLPIAPNSLTTFTVGGKCGVPFFAAFSANVTVTQPTSAGDLRLFAGDIAIPNVATIAFSSGQTRGNNAIIALSQDGAGTIKVRNDAPGTVHLVLDVNGYFQ
jgi:hypothetical protein